MRTDIVTKVLDTAETSMKYAEQEVHHLSMPVRQSVVRRFPILFTLLVTFGVASVMFGFERILDDIVFLHTHPFVMLFLGVLTLIITGTLYKKL